MTSSTIAQYLKNGVYYMIDRQISCLLLSEPCPLLSVPFHLEQIETSSEMWKSRDQMTSSAMGQYLENSFKYMIFIDFFFTPPRSFCF